jgi:hypothetical protein
MGALVTPVWTLILAGTAALLAFAWYNGQGGWMLAAGLVSLAAIVILSLIGHLALPNRPVVSVGAYEFRIYAIAALTAVLAGLAIIVGIEWVGEGAGDGETGPAAEYKDALKEIVGSASAALVAFITGLGVKPEAFDESVGDTVEAAFDKAYPATPSTPPRRNTVDLPPDSDAFAAARDPEYRFSGWGKSARRKRARVITHYLTTRKPPARTTAE